MRGFGQLVLQRSTVSNRSSALASTTIPTAKPLRSWRGEVHEVLITDKGYVYRGELFQKLSPIAKRITGTQ